MTIEEIILTYKEVKALPSKCHLNWLKDNFNPILKQMDNNLNINWACSNCMRNYMNMLIGWYDRQQVELKKQEAIKKAEQIKPKPKKKVAKKVAKKPAKPKKATKKVVKKKTVKKSKKKK